MESRLGQMPRHGANGFAVTFPRLRRPVAVNPSAPDPLVFKQTVVLAAVKRDIFFHARLLLMFSHRQLTPADGIALSYLYSERGRREQPGLLTFSLTWWIESCD